MEITTINELKVLKAIRNGNLTFHKICMSCGLVYETLKPLEDTLLSNGLIDKFSYELNKDGFVLTQKGKQVLEQTLKEIDSI